MQKINITILLIALMSMVGVKAMAHDVEAKNADGVTIYYNYINNSTELEVTYSTSGTGDYQGNIVIPRAVVYEGKTYSVTAIGEEAFYWRSEVTSVSIPNSVKSIKDNAFADCRGLTSIDIPNSVTTIGRYAFVRCSSLASVTIANGVTSIGFGAFYECGSLTSITIPNSVTTIADYAFYGCGSLASVTIPDSMTTIADWTFGNCSGLTSVTMLNGVTNISYAAFAYCSSLASVTIPNSVNYIDDYAFYGCTSLTDVTIADGTTTLEFARYSIFGDCPIESVYMGRNIEFPVVWLSVGYTCVSPFQDIESIVSFTIGDKVTFIGEYTFGGCAGLTEVTIPNSVKSIGSWSFTRCTGLAKMTIPNSVTYCGEYAFNGCDNLKEIVIADGTDELKMSRPFGYYNGILEKVYIGRNIKRGTTPGVFESVRTITSVVIGNSVTSIDEDVFFNCTGLTEVTIPNNVTSIGRYAFDGCSGLTSLTIGSGVKEIGSFAFETRSPQPESIVIISLLDNPTNIDTSSFSGLYNDATLYVPQGTTDKYKARDGWKLFKHIIEGTPSGIDATLMNSEERTIKATYDLGGKQLSQPQRGLNIVKMSDGTVKKVAVK
ncbi:MAG: leucine-rich repeat domain-containing protein [Prevotella sp.]|nr:leucine-rich repeat domain-containing protein [Prevotella sp.]